MEEEFLNEILPYVEALTKPLERNVELRKELKKIKESNNKDLEILKYYQSALEKSKKSFSYERELYDCQILNMRTLAENYERQIALLGEERSEISYYREQIILIRNEIAILEDKLNLIIKNKELRKQIASDSKVSILKHEAFKLQEKLKLLRYQQ